MRHAHVPRSLLEDILRSLPAHEAEMSRKHCSSLTILELNCVCTTVSCAWFCPILTTLQATNCSLVDRNCFHQAKCHGLHVLPHDLKVKLVSTLRVRFPHLVPCQGLIMLELLETWSLVDARTMRQTFQTTISFVSKIWTRYGAL